MKLVLLSGGSGKRLWPLSNESRSKQFLKILEDQSGNYVSMVQRVYQQLETVNMKESAVIATSKSQVEMIQSQLGTDVSIVIEPERRDTFPAIALSSVYLYSEQNADLNEVVAVLPVDPYVENEFFKKVVQLEQVVVQGSDTDLALIGVKPTFPSSKYGYIIPEATEETGEDCLPVSHFKEKPSEESARELIEHGAFWNCGVFAFKLKYIINIVKQLGLPLNYQELLKKYHLLPKNSFDYEVVEKANSIVVLPYGGYWKDLGTWNTLTEEMGSNVIGLGKISEDSHNTHLVNELEIPVAILGVKDLLVAASPDGILVTEKAASPRLKEMITDFDQRPMYEERRWGWYKVLDYTKFDDGTEMLTKKICIVSGKNLSYQLHDKRSEIWTIVKGEGEIVLNDQLHFVMAGDVVKVPTGYKHAIRANADLEIIEVQRGSELIEEDITRLELVWDKILNRTKESVHSS
ncbi:cupin domain-containing protein [Bacillus sp. EB106-08-02-XG196]|uniref:sugar phosphate nucleotidyltransferase n=1 Tax=Bacillus sp. EB106-08-02-XG196 TaxID=2737049 RepID=UPI0015C4B58C|nr:sugar phosphate nucleotidyltransferase [Bacillus sp. EB106-08-02-XG196]NWQ39497.1 cupin domain-containing protein [Bacillus sp. EB106-08-02-XG196]